MGQASLLIPYVEKVSGVKAADQLVIGRPLHDADEQDHKDASTARRSNGGRLYQLASRSTSAACQQLPTPVSLAACATGPNRI